MMMIMMTTEIAMGMVSGLQNGSAGMPADDDADDDDMMVITMRLG